MRDMVRCKWPELSFYCEAPGMGIYLYIFVQLWYDIDENHIHDLLYTKQLLQQRPNNAVVVSEQFLLIIYIFLYSDSPHISISPVSRKKQVNCYPKKWYFQSIFIKI